jgi:hypothetical protein
VSTVRLVAFYSVAQVTLTARAETAAGVDVVITMITGGVLTEPVVFTATPPDTGGRVGAYPGRRVHGGCGRCGGVAAGGPGRCRWRADGEDAVGGLAAIVQAADRVDTHRRPPGLPPPGGDLAGEDLAGPDARPAPVDAAVAAGHLRAAAELVAVARHRLRPAAGQQRARLPQADPAAARVGYAAEQSAGLVPAPAGPPPRLPAESPADLRIRPTAGPCVRAALAGAARPGASRLATR